MPSVARWAGYQGDHGKEDERSDQIVQSRHGIRVLVTGPEVFKVVTTERDGAGAVASAMPPNIKARYMGGSCKPENDTKHQADHKKGSHRFCNGGNDDLCAGLFHLFPDQLGSDHQSERTFKNALYDFKPFGIQNGGSQQIQGVGPMTIPVISHPRMAGSLSLEMIFPAQNAMTTEAASLST